MSLDTVIILTTVETPEQARHLSLELLESQLAACVTIHPVCVSHYYWNDALETSNECPLTIKTTTLCVDKIEELFKTAHPYECPEFVVINNSHASTYTKWISHTIHSSNH